MVDGVITSKEQAQVAFENAVWFLSESFLTVQVRSTVPGKIATVEHVTGNIFRCRIFPVPVSGRVVKVLNSIPSNR